MPNTNTFSTREVAERLGVSVQTIQRWVDVGQLRAWKTLGGHRRIDADSVETLIRTKNVPPHHQPAATAALRVLLVDDNPFDLQLLEVCVRAALPAAEITKAVNGFEALIAVGHVVPDVLITDIVMPHMDGLEMLAHLVGSPRTAPRLILATSSHSVPEIAQLGTLPDGVRFLPKPIEPAVLTGLLTTAELRATAP